MTKQWPKGCLLENAAPHPREPWLAVAGSNGEAEYGAVMVFDAQTGALRNVARHEQCVGWDDPGLLRWHPEGRLLASNVETNGIGLVDGDEWVGFANPDETRDHGVSYTWVGDQIFTDTGNLFEIQPGDERFDFEDSPLRLGRPEWNASIGAVVGSVDGDLLAFDPRRGALVYHERLPARERTRLHWAPDGRWCVREHGEVPPAFDELLFIDGDSGRVHGLRRPSSPRLDALLWGREGRLAVRSHVHHDGPRRSDERVDIFVAGERQTTIELGSRAVKSSHSVAEASGMAWSPDGAGLALLLDQQEVRVHDARSGALLSSFFAPAPPIPPGLPDYYREDYGVPGDLLWLPGYRLARLASHFVSLWTIDGQKLAEFVVPV